MSLFSQHHSTTTVGAIQSQWKNITFHSPILVHLNERVTVANYVIYTTEFLFSVFGLNVVYYFAYFVWNHSIFHKNLARLLIVAAICYSIGALARWYLLLVQLKWVTDLETPWFLIASFLRYEQYGYTVSLIPVIAIERSFATYYILDYESRSRSWVLVNCLIFSFLNTQFFALLLTFPGARFIFIVIWSLTWSVSGNILICYLYKHNSSELRRVNWNYENMAKMREVQYTLGKKYQLEENIKVTKFLMLLGLMLFIFIFSFLLIMIFLNLIIDNESFRQVIASLFDFSIALASVLIPTISLYFLNVDKKIFRRPKSAVTPKMMAIDGNTEKYFDQLKKSWN